MAQPQQASLCSFLTILLLQIPTNKILFLLTSQNSSITVLCGVDFAGKYCHL
jgi:hypothetical protein